MKKNLQKIIILCFSIIFCFLASFSTIYAFASTNDKVVITTTASITDLKITVNVNLEQNPGINACVLQVDYNKNILSTPNISFKSALSSLNPISSGGGGNEEFKILYDNATTDSSIGLMFVLTFDIKPNVNDGEYYINIIPIENSVYSYNINGQNKSYSLKDKTIAVQSVKFNISGSKFDDLQIFDYVESQSKGLSVGVIILISLAVCFGVGFLITMISIKIKAKNWESID